jgi:hypothetical protein
MACLASCHSYQRRLDAEVREELGFRLTFGERFRPSLASPAKTVTAARFVSISSTPSCLPLRESVLVHRFPYLSSFPARSFMEAHALRRLRPPGATTASSRFPAEAAPHPCPRALHPRHLRAPARRAAGSRRYLVGAGAAPCGPVPADPACGPAPPWPLCCRIMPLAGRPAEAPPFPMSSSSSSVA